MILIIPENGSLLTPCFPNSSEQVSKASDLYATRRLLKGIRSAVAMVITLKWLSLYHNYARNTLLHEIHLRVIIFVDGILNLIRKLAENHF